MLERLMRDMEKRLTDRIEALDEKIEEAAKIARDAAKFQIGFQGVAKALGIILALATMAVLILTAIHTGAL